LEGVYELNKSDLSQKIYLPKLEILTIEKRSDLNYFIGLDSIKYISITSLDEINYSTIDQILNKATLFDLVL